MLITGVHLTGVHPMTVYFTGVHLIGVRLMGVHPHGRAGHLTGVCFRARGNMRRRPQPVFVLASLVVLPLESQALTFFSARTRTSSHGRTSIAIPPCLCPSTLDRSCVPRGDISGWRFDRRLCIRRGLIDGPPLCRKGSDKSNATHRSSEYPCVFETNHVRGNNSREVLRVWERLS
jgi:hypothetical protein